MRNADALRSKALRIGSTDEKWIMQEDWHLLFTPRAAARPSSPKKMILLSMILPNLPRALSTGNLSKPSYSFR